MIRMSPTHTEQSTKTSLLIGDNFGHGNHVTVKDWFYLIPRVLMLAANTLMWFKAAQRVGRLKGVSG